VIHIYTPAVTVPLEYYWRFPAADLKLDRQGHLRPEMMPLKSILNHNFLMVVNRNFRPLGIRFDFIPMHVHCRHKSGMAIWAF
jgi:hypothetical protein